MTNSTRPKTYFYLIRHGMTEWNVLHRIQGTTDIPLSELGISQAVRVKDHFRDLPIDLYCSSPLVRATETMRLLFGVTDDQIITDDRLKERYFGRYEGILVNQDMANLISEDNPEFDGETFDEITARMKSFIADYWRRYPGKTIAVTSHGAIISAFLRDIKPADVDTHLMHMDNCARVMVSYDGAHYVIEEFPQNYLTPEETAMGIYFSQEE